MKNRIFALILSVLMIVPMFSVIASANGNEAQPVSENEVSTTTEKTDYSEEEKIISKMTVCASKGDLRLYIDEKTGVMAVKNKKTGVIVLSNHASMVNTPVRNETDGSLKVSVAENLSQIVVEVYTITDGTQTKYFSYQNCFEGGYQTIQRLLDGVKVDYVLSNDSPKRVFPTKIAYERMHELLASMPEKERNDFISKYYVKFYPYEKDQNGKYILQKFERDPMIKQYPICATTPIYVIDSSVLSASGETARYFIEKTFLEYANYTEEQQKADYEVVKESVDQFNVEKIESPKVELSVTYMLTETGLKATFDASTLKYDRSKYNITSVSILPHFAEAKPNEVGYAFLPDGSGVLVRFEDILGKFRGVISEDMYGNDYTYHMVTIKNSEQYTMPIIGLVNHSKKDAYGYLAIIEEGDTIARPSFSHDPDAFNSAYVTFKITPSDVYDYANYGSGEQKNNSVTISASKIYDKKCVVSYNLLTSEQTAKDYGIDKYYDTSYVGMAKLYRDYLIEKGAISKLTETNENVKLFLEVFGSIEVDDKFLTFPIRTNKALTTFSDVINMQKYFSENGIGNMSFILKGFANGGLTSTYPSKIKWQKDVGGKNGLKELLAHAKVNNYDVALDVDFSYAYDDEAFNGYSDKDNASKTVDNRYSTKRNYYASTQTFERTGGVVVSSASFVSMYTKFYDSIEDYSFTTLAPRTLGSDLNSDFNKKDFYSREDSKANVVKVLERMTSLEGKKNYNLILDKGNSYAMQYASAVLSVSLDSSRRRATSECVPFFGMVYHGSVEFAGNALNSEGDSKYMFLKALENGSTLYYTLVANKDNTAYLKFDPELNKYYSVDYNNLRDDIIKTYKEFNELMKDKQNQYIVNHEYMNSKYGYNVTRLEDGKPVENSLVVRVVYENGTGFILNYNDYAVVVEGVADPIPALSYVTITVE